MHTETITWQPVTAGLPDADMCVLIACDTNLHAEPVWIGFHDGEGWREANCEPAFVTHWAQLPAAPATAALPPQAKAEPAGVSHTVSGFMDLLRSMGLHPHSSDQIRQIREYAAHLEGGYSGTDVLEAHTAGYKLGMAQVDRAILSAAPSAGVREEAAGVPEAQSLPSEGAIHPLAAAEPLQLLIDEVGRMRRALDAIYSHNEAARAAVVQHYGTTHKDISLLVSVLRARGVVGTLEENGNG